MQNEEFSVEDLSGLCFWVLYLQACFVIAWMADKTVGKQNYTDKFSYTEERGEREQDSFRISITKVWQLAS